MVEEIPTGIHIPMREILQRLNILNGSIQLLSHQLDIFQENFKKSYEKQDIDSSYIFAGFALIIPDLLTPTNKRTIDEVHGGAYFRKGEEYFKAGEEFVKNWSSWTIAQSYEAFETFLRDTASYYFYERRPQEPIGKLQQVPINAENIDAWKSLFRERKWEPSTLLNLFRTAEPKITEVEKNNILQIDLQQWLLIYMSARHAITHSNSRLLRQDLSNISAASIEKMLPTFFPGSWTGDTYNIDCSEESAIKIIKITGSYAFLIYKKLCNKGDIPLLIDVMK